MTSENMFKEKRFHPLKGLFYVLFAVGAIAILSAVVMYLWNNCLAEVVNVKQISYWQAAGLLILSKIFFGFGFRGKHRGGYMQNRKKWKDKWIDMSAEERAVFKEKWRERCGKN